MLCSTEISLGMSYVVGRAVYQQQCSSMSQVLDKQAGDSKLLLFWFSWRLTDPLLSMTSSTAGYTYGFTHYNKCYLETG